MTSLEIYKHAAFYKILLIDFSSKLRIPKEFVKKYGEILPQAASFLLEKDQSGKSWDVKIKKLDEDFYFKNGWPEFVKDNHLIGTDFLLFKLVNKSTFQVSIYGKDGILKKLCPPDFNNEAQTSYQRGENAARIMGESQTREENCESEIKSFNGVVKKYNKYFMMIPKAFATETGIASKTVVNLQNAQGKKWQVGIYNSRGDGRIWLTKGWFAFRRANKLCFGTKFKFEFDAISGNLIFKEIANESPAAKRGRGRPRKIIVPVRMGRAKIVK